jgi:tetratricopeptide (TPR) repeat protein
MRFHPQDLTLQELVESLGSSNKAILQHILGCNSCLARARYFLEARPNAVKANNVVALDRWVATTRACSESSSAQLDRLQSAFEREREQAGQLVQELLNQSPERRRLLARNHVRFQTWAVCDHLLNRSWELNFSAAARAEEIARLATEVGDLLDDSRYGHERVEDLRARAWAYLGNSRRILSDLAESESAFERAMCHLKEGTGEPMERAVILDLRASLYRAQRRFDEALRLLRRAVATFRELGETHRAGRSLMGMAFVHQVQGDPEEAIPLIYQAIDLIEPEREPRLVFSAWHGLIDNLAELGRYLEAHKLSIQARPIFQRFSEPWAQNPRKVVEARIARGLGQREQAEALFLAVRTALMEEGAPYDVALVSLDLATLYLEQGRNDEARRITEEALPIFNSRRIHREALAAFLSWSKAVEAGHAEAGMAAAVASFLKRSRHDPSLKFERPGSPARS